jgi:glycine cleavage system transcriptional repressor
MPQLIVTAVGPDRAGIVADLSQQVLAVGASLADSRMVNLRGHFALLALVEGAAEQLASLRGQLLAGAEAMGLSVEVRDADARSLPPAGSVPYRLKTYSVDQPGIVARITEVLRAHQANVEELETRVESAPFAGTPLFLLEAVITLPPSMTARKLREALEGLEEALGCDVDLDPLGSDRAR